jgi:F0F1-type ATP synthase assembly protein I
MASGPDFRAASEYFMIGMECVVSFALGAAGGIYLDRRVGGGTLWPIVGGALGFALGVWNIIRLVRRKGQGRGGKGQP